MRRNDTKNHNRQTSLARFVRFLITSGIAAAVNIGARVALSLVMPFEVAIVFAFLFGVTTAYVLARVFVFDRSGLPFGAEFSRFLIINLFALMQVWIVSVGLANWLFPAINFVWQPELVAHTAGVASPVASSYYLHKFFTFRRARS